MKKFKLDEQNNFNNNNKNSGSGIRGIFNSLSLYNDPSAIFGYNPLKFYCMDCGKEHRKRICPKCGSMAVRVGWKIYKKIILSILSFFSIYFAYNCNYRSSIVISKYSIKSLVRVN